MLALQLRDMSTHLDKVMNDIKEDLSVYKPAEEELAKRFDMQGIEYFQIDALSEEPGQDVMFVVFRRKNQILKQIRQWRSALSYRC